MSITHRLKTDRNVNIHMIVHRADGCVKAQCTSWHDDLPDVSMSFRFAADIGSCDYRFPGVEVRQQHVKIYKDLVTESINHAEKSTGYIATFRTERALLTKMMESFVNQARLSSAHNLTPRANSKGNPNRTLREGLLYLVALRDPRTSHQTLSEALTLLVKSGALGKTDTCADIERLGSSEKSVLHDLVLDMHPGDKHIQGLDPASAIAFGINTTAIVA